ncbi:tyrosine-type recombinase/integrase [Fodinibius salsisoli]|uniref:Integrase arm-type DNA-binding domain-containing protein n=1 Tax=Fodinibius salsisoli TaxID=2820877 RepID=A0ABT3PQE7_9BACT|nr:site-specific integrase [Fodinibius salsisoli]MCW9708084.1 integrase arm-type DNA-binding domain-containing protein [Fodinibius salsisoli]
MEKLKLTDPFIRHYPAPNKRTEIYDEHTSGLAVRITAKGTKSFVYRYRFNDKVRRFTIGRFPKTSLAEARERAGELERKVSEGIDPMEAKKARKSKPQPKKFEYLANQFKKKHLPTLKESTQKTYTERIDGEMIPAFKGMAVKNISRGVIIELLEDILDRGSPYQSNRVRAILSSMFSFGVQREIAEYNPVKTIKPLGKEEKRDRVLEEDEIKKLWEGFGTIKQPTGSLFRMLLLLGQRLGETRRMKWEHIEDGIWTIPKELTKAKRTHYLPLPPLALEIIESLSNDSPYVFQSPMKDNEPLSSVHSSFNRLQKDLSIDNIRIHDFRRTAATYMAELGTDRTILGKVLNHKGLAGDSQVTARYDRHGYVDEKRTALNRWSHKLQQIIEGTETKITKIG